MPSNRSRPFHRLSAIAALTVVILVVKVWVPALIAKPPLKPVPTMPKQNWFGINWNKLIPKSFPKIRIHMPKAPRAAHIPKQMPKQAGLAPQPQVRVNQTANVPNAIPQPRVAAPKTQPIMKPALHELSEAWLYVNASPLLATRSRNALSSHIGQALTGLGGAMPKTSPAGKKGNHLKLAEEHLVKANKEVLLLSHLEPDVQKSALKEIKSAMDLVRKHAKAVVGGKDAKP